MCIPTYTPTPVLRNLFYEPPTRRPLWGLGIYPGYLRETIDKFVSF